MKTIFKVRKANWGKNETRKGKKTARRMKWIFDFLFLFEITNRVVCMSKAITIRPDRTEFRDLKGMVDQLIN